MPVQFWRQFDYGKHTVKLKKILFISECICILVFLLTNILKCKRNCQRNHDRGNLCSCEYSGWNLCVLGNNCHFSWYCCYYNANVVIFWYYYCKRKKTILQFEKLEIEPQFFEYSSYVLLDISKEMLFLFYVILSNYYN